MQLALDIALGRVCCESCASSKNAEEGSVATIAVPSIRLKLHQNGSAAARIAPF